MARNYSCDKNYPAPGQPDVHGERINRNALADSDPPAPAEPEPERSFVAILEFVKGPSDRSGSIEHLNILLDRMAESQPAALYSPGRYAFQIRVPGSDPPGALQNALQLHNASLTQLDFQGWRVVRSEIVDEIEFDRSLDSQEALGPSWPSESRGAYPRGYVPKIIHQATRELLTSRSAFQACNAILNYVVRVGGHVSSTPDAEEWVWPEDLSLGEGPPVFAAAPVESVVRIQLEEALPDLLHDAERLAELFRTATHFGGGGARRSRQLGARRD